MRHYYLIWAVFEQFLMNLVDLALVGLKLSADDTLVLSVSLERACFTHHLVKSDLFDSRIDIV